MRVARLSPILLLMALAPGLAGGDDFRGPGGCRINFPGHGRKQTSFEERTPANGWLNIQLQEEEQGSYSLSWFELSPQQATISPASLEAILKQSRAETVSRQGFKLLSEDRRTLQDRYPGFELVLEKKSPGKEMIRVRTWFVGLRVYQVQVTGQKAWVESDDATKFLDSFSSSN